MADNLLRFHLETTSDRLIDRYVLSNAITHDHCCRTLSINLYRFYAHTICPTQYCVIDTTKKPHYYVIVVNVI